MKKPFKDIRTYLPIALLLLCKTSEAQKIELGSWNIINIKYNVDKKWSFFGEAQIRSLKFYDDFHYYEYKAGINFKAHKNLTLTFAAGNYDTYKEGGNFKTPKNNDEFRLWPQITMRNSIGSFIIEQRYRAEFRFTSNGYKNRYRYRLGISQPLGRLKPAGYKPYLIGISNELFLTNKAAYFERNRILFSLGYKLSTNTSVQLGYLHQFDYKINDETGRDFLQIGLYVELFKKLNKQTNL